jgi:hypothetical protein
MDKLLLDSDTRDTYQTDAAQDQDDGDDLLAWLTRDNVTGPFADRRFII